MALKASSTPGSIPSPDSSSGTPRRMPFRSVAVGSLTGSGSPSACCRTGPAPTIAPSSSAASVTSRVNGPAWSSDDANAIIP